MCCVGVCGMHMCAYTHIHTHNCIDISSRVLYAYVSVLSAFISILPANLSVSTFVKKTLLCVGCRHLSVNSSCFFSVYLCLSLCQADSHECLQKERTHLSQLKGSPQRELRSPSILVGICDCQRSDKMPSGQLCAPAGRDLTLHWWVLSRSFIWDKSGLVKAQHQCLN